MKEGLRASSIEASLALVPRRKVWKVLLVPNDGLHTSLLSFEVTICGASFTMFFSIFRVLFGTKVCGNGFSRALTLVFLARAPGMTRHLTISVAGILD